MSRLSGCHGDHGQRLENAGPIGGTRWLRSDTLLGRGGIGEMHREYDTVHDRVVALKRLSDVYLVDEAFCTRSAVSRRWWRGCASRT